MVVACPAVAGLRALQVQELENTLMLVAGETAESWLGVGEGKGRAGTKPLRSFDRSALEMALVAVVRGCSGFGEEGVSPPRFGKHSAPWSGTATDSASGNMAKKSLGGMSVQEYLPWSA
jgi:hypothetical protein